MKLLALVLLLPFSALAQTITASNVNAQAGAFDLSIDSAVSVQLAIVDGTAKFASCAGSSNVASFTASGPLSVHCTYTPSVAFPTTIAIVGGVTKRLAQSGSAWVASFGTVTPPVTPPPVVPPPVSPPPPTVTGTSDLKWDAVTTNTNGTPATIASYKAYWGTTAGNYPNSTNVGNVTAYTVVGLAPGTWYFAVTAINTAGAESALSAPASKTIPGTVTPPPPPPTDPCVASPLTFSVQTWPSAPTGRRTLSYTTNRQASVTHSWSPQRAVAIDDRGCKVTISK